MSTSVKQIQTQQRPCHVSSNNSNLSRAPRHFQCFPCPHFLSTTPTTPRNRVPIPKRHLGREPSHLSQLEHPRHPSYRTGSLANQSLQTLSRTPLSFPQRSTSALGIAELEPDVFAVAVGNITVSTIASVPGSCSVWRIDMQHNNRRMGKAKVSKIAEIPQAGFLNGATAIPGHTDSVLLADGLNDGIYHLDANTGTSKTWLSDPAFAPNATLATESGINGLQFHNGDDSYVYFTNSMAAPALGRIPIDEATALSSGPVEYLVSHATWPTQLVDQADDFTFDREGSVLLTTNPGIALVKITLSNSGGEASVVAEGVDDALIAGDTAAMFGRTRRDRDVLYVSTNGGIAYPGTTGVEGGKVVALDGRNF